MSFGAKVKIPAIPAVPTHLPKAPGGATTGNHRPVQALAPKLQGQTAMVNRLTTPQFNAANPNRKTQAL